jgi:hypothetical protein
MRPPSNAPGVTLRPALSDEALSWAHRLVWVLCIGVYLSVYIGGIQGGGAELITLGRAVAFTLGVALLGRKALGLLSRASLPVEEGRSAGQQGPLGSLVDLASSANVAAQEHDAEAV